MRKTFSRRLWACGIVRVLSDPPTKGAAARIAESHRFRLASPVDFREDHSAKIDLFSPASPVATRPSKGGFCFWFHAIHAHTTPRQITRASRSLADLAIRGKSACAQPQAA
jgi:hypothetical protein